MPTARESLLMNARVSAARGDVQAARSSYRRALKGPGSDIELLIEFAVFEAGTNRLESARNLLGKAERLRPGDPSIAINLGELARLGGDHRTAADSFARAAQLLPEDADARFGLGEALLALGQAAEAAVVLAEAAHLSPRDPEIHQSWGDALWRIGETSRAAAAFRRSIELAPRMASAWPRLARCLYRLNRPADAAQAFAQADSVSPLAAGDLILWARALHASGRPDLALQAAQRGVTGGNVDAEALYLCGISLQELGRFDESEASLRRAFDMEPQRTETIEALAAMGRTRSEDARLLEALLDADSGMSPTARASAGFALYRIHDRNDDLEAAFASLTRANEIKAAIEPFDAAAHRDTIDGMLKTFDAGFFQHLEPVTWTPDFTPIFILGMPRAGTTLTEQILAHFPQVHAGGERIPFGKVLSEAFDDMAAVAGQDPDWAEQQARLIAEHLREGSNGAGFVTDKTPGNYMALPFIAWMFPTARVILCRRDPRDVGFSCYEQNFRRGATFAYRLDAFACAWHGFADITRHWQDVSPVEIFDLNYESLVREPETVGKQLVEFCGLPWTADCLDTTRASNAIQTASFWQARQPINTRSIGRWRRYQSYLGEFLSMLGRIDDP